MSSLVWTTTDAHAHELLAMDSHAFVDALNDGLYRDNHQSDFVNTSLLAFNRISDLFLHGKRQLAAIPPTATQVIEGSRASFPLGFGHSTSYVDHRVALIGDAAHRIHPLAGQGVNLGFRDVQELVRVLESAVQQGADLGSINHLYAYERRRQTKNLPVMLAIDWLNRLYATSWLPFVLPRSLGLCVVNRLEPLKKLIMSEAAV